jgi:hypothetical protein
MKPICRFLYNLKRSITLLPLLDWNMVRDREGKRGGEREIGREGERDQSFGAMVNNVNIIGLLLSPPQNWGPSPKTITVRNLTQWKSYKILKPGILIFKHEFSLFHHSHLFAHPIFWTNPDLVTQIIPAIRKLP